MENKIIYRITGNGGEQKLVTITKNQFDYFSDKDADFIREDALFQSVDVPSELSLEEWSSVFGELDISGFTFGFSYLEINYNSEFKKILLNKTELKKQTTKRFTENFFRLAMQQQKSFLEIGNRSLKNNSTLP